MPKRFETNCRTTFQFQLAISMPDISGNSCTAPVNSACCVSPSAGGNPRSARISRLQALPRRRRRPICRWCEHPGPVPGRWPRRSGPGTGATVRATVLSPGVSALGTSCCAHQPSPTVTPPSPALSPSYPSPSPLSLLAVLMLCLPDSGRRKCGFHLGFGLVLQLRVMRKHAQVFFFSYGPFIMGDSHSFVASFKIRPRVTL